jgi:curved DNA-binding protein CbpA
MAQQSQPGGGLALLAEAFRSKRTGLLVVGEGTAALRVKLEAGQIVALGPAPAEATAATPMPKPNDSVRLRLERVLSEIGMRKPLPNAELTPAPPPRTLRDRLIERLADDSQSVSFQDGSEAPENLVAVAVATEPLILEAVRQMRHDEAVRAALGDLDQRLVATTALADERTLTLTEGYLLSRIDGLLSVRQVLQLVPLDPNETERTLLGLVLTGRVERRPVPAQKQAAKLAPQPVADAAPVTESAPPAAAGPLVEPEPLADATPVAEAAPEPEAPPVAEARAQEVVAEPDDSPVVEAIPDDADAPAEVAAADAPTAPLPVQPALQPPDAATIGRRRDILEFFQSLPLKNHFEVLGVEPGCTDADVRKAYVTLVKRFHPDSQRDRRLEDLHDILEAITIRVGEAWEVLGEARSRASYESKSGIVRRSTTITTTTLGQANPSVPVPPGASAASEPGEYVPPEEILFRARRLLAQARYWDAIQVLESALPGMEPRSQQHRGRLLLARAYSKNPNWLRRAEEMLQELMREDPTNADVHFELGLLYQTGGFTARAHGMFRRALELRPGHKEASAQLGIQAAAPDGGGGGLLKRLFKRGKAS